MRNVPDPIEPNEPRPSLNYRYITTSVGGPKDPSVTMYFDSVEAAQAVHHWLAVLQEPSQKSEVESVNRYRCMRCNKPYASIMMLDAHEELCGSEEPENNDERMAADGDSTKGWDVDSRDK